MRDLYTRGTGERNGIMNGRGKAMDGLAKILDLHRRRTGEKTEQENLMEEWEFMGVFERGYDALPVAQKDIWK